MTNEPIRDPKKLQEGIIQFQDLQRKVQVYEAQTQQMQMQIEELKMAQDAIKNSSGKVYKAIGTMLVETKRDDAKAELVEKVELLEVRLKTLKKQDEKTKEEIDNLRKELEKMTQQMKSS
jgi:prefoldin beta subunit